MSLWKKIALGLLACVALVVFVPGGWGWLLAAAALVAFGLFCCFLWWEDSRPRR